ncbi:MAG: hypothetical protein FD180_4076 [Planctomycetota bacterium]|nr:MAG: hypothetical protein FD180_4076 [Planctomycetota bacterium]
MRWILFCAVAGAAAFAIAGCGEPDTNGDTGPMKVDSGANDEPCAEPYEFAFFEYARKGDTRKKANTMYTLLYTQGWMKSRTFGGPFEAQVKREGIEVFWKESKKRATHDLYVYMYEKGFFDLPGDDLVDWNRFKQPGYTTKAVSVTRDDVRHIVFFEDVTGERGDDPRWNTFNDCVSQLLTTYSTIEDVRARVQKGGFDSALEDYLKGR